LSVLNFIDYLGLKAHQYSYVLSLANEWTLHKLQDWPNFIYSAAIAQFQLEMRDENNSVSYIFFNYGFMIIISLKTFFLSRLMKLAQQCWKKLFFIFHLLYLSCPKNVIFNLKMILLKVR
jgi:hypothetical protein